MRVNGTSCRMPIRELVVVLFAFSCFGHLLHGNVLSASTAKGVWRERGFSDFVDGTFGNAGQNLYVSRAGTLQRIHQFDFNKDGYFDLVICNAQEYWEQAPTYVYTDPLRDPAQRVEVPSDGAMSAAVADLNGDGYDDLALGMFYNGVRADLNSFIYHGSPKGYSERRHLRLPTMKCLSVAAGDLDGDGAPDLAFLLEDRVRVFYQNKLGFEQQRFHDLPIEGADLAAADLDGDGFAELIVRTAENLLNVHWGGRRGLLPKNVSQVIGGATRRVEDDAVNPPERVAEAAPLARVIHLAKVPHLFLPEPERVLLVPVSPDRKFGKPIRLDCPKALAVAAGDVNGDGHEDLVFACRESYQGRERSWIYWGGAKGYEQERRTPLTSRRACDVALADVDGDGCEEIALCQHCSNEAYSSTSLLYRGSADGVIAKPIELASEDARRVFFVRSCDAKRPQLVLVNHFSGELLGNPDVSIFLGGPDGFDARRRIRVAGWGAVEAVCCDLNDDRNVDLVLANCSENSIHLDPGSYVFFGGGDGPSHEPSLKLPTTRAHGAACADLDRDGFLDLVFCGFDNPDLLIFHGTKQGFDSKNPKRIRLHHDGVLYKEPRWIYLADLNNNGWLDLVVPLIIDDRSLILWGGPEGFRMKNCLALSVERAACARAADISGNGYLDLILGGHNVTTGVPHDSFAYIYWNGPAGLRQDRRSMLPAAGINGMAVADFNNDGLLDLFVGSYHAGTVRDTDSYLYWNRKGRGFAARDRERLFTHSASGCMAVDFNEDGWVDLAVANHKVWGDHRGWSAVWWNGPKGFDERHITRLPSTGPHGMSCVGPGNQRDGGPEEYYESSAFQLPHAAVPTHIRWKAEIPPKTWVKAQWRSAASKEKLPGAPWVGPEGPGTWFTKPRPLQRRVLAGPWIQYRLALGATNALATPRVTEVSIDYVQEGK